MGKKTLFACLCKQLCLHYNLTEHVNTISYCTTYKEDDSPWGEHSHFHHLKKYFKGELRNLYLDHSGRLEVCKLYLAYRPLFIPSGYIKLLKSWRWINPALPRSSFIDLSHSHFPISIPAVPKSTSNPILPLHSYSKLNMRGQTLGGQHALDSITPLQSAPNTPLFLPYIILTFSIIHHTHLVLPPTPPLRLLV